MDTNSFSEPSQAGESASQNSSRLSPRAIAILARRPNGLHASKVFSTNEEMLQFAPTFPGLGEISLAPEEADQSGDEGSLVTPRMNIDDSHSPYGAGPEGHSPTLSAGSDTYAHSHAGDSKSDGYITPQQWRSTGAQNPGTYASSYGPEGPTDRLTVPPNNDNRQRSHSNPVLPQSHGHRDNSAIPGGPVTQHPAFPSHRRSASTGHPSAGFYDAPRSHSQIPGVDTADSAGLITNRSVPAYRTDKQAADERQLWEDGTNTESCVCS